MSKIASAATPNAPLVVPVLPSDFRSNLGAAIYAAWNFPKPQRRVFVRTAQMLRSAQGTQPQTIATAAAALNAVGLVDEAALLLLRNDLVAAAASLFIKHGRYRHAASLYKRLRRWADAAELYNLAGAYEKAGRCAARANNNRLAAEAFEKAGNVPAAATFHARDGNLQMAARLFYKCGRMREAASVFVAWLVDGAGVNVTMAGSDTDTLLDLTVHHVSDLRLIRHLVNCGLSDRLVIALLKADKGRLAAEIYKPRAASLRRSLLAIVFEEPKLVHPVKLLLEAAGDQMGLGLFYEDLARYQEAADAYKQAGDLEGAYRCCLICNEWTAATRLRKELGADPADLKTRAKEQSESDKELDSMQQFLDSKFLAGLTSEERTSLWSLGYVKHFPRGSAIVDFDEATLGTLTVLTGEVEVLKDDEETGPKAVNMGTPRNIGAAWSLLPLTSQVKVVATTDCDIHVLDRDRLAEFLSNSGATGDDSLSTRLADGVLRHLALRIYNDQPDQANAA